MTNFHFDDIMQQGFIAPRRLAARLQMSVSRLAQLARLRCDIMLSQPHNSTVQDRLVQISKILVLATRVTEDEERAVMWFRADLLPGWNRTAEQLVEGGLEHDVLEALERQIEGVYS